MTVNSPSKQHHLESAGADACVLQCSHRGLSKSNVLQIIQSTSQQQMYCGVVFVFEYVSCMP